MSNILTQIPGFSDPVHDAQQDGHFHDAGGGEDAVGIDGDGPAVPQVLHMDADASVEILGECTEATLQTMVGPLGEGRCHEET